jgi:hypothetical protein
MLLMIYATVHYIHYEGIQKPVADIVHIAVPVF